VLAYFLFILVSSFSISCEHPKKKLTLINNILEEEKPKLSKCYKKLLQNKKFHCKMLKSFQNIFEYDEFISSKKGIL
jgi:hypothetical protein